MTNPTLPAYLHLLADDFAEHPGDYVDSTTMEDGIIKTAVVRQLAYSRRQVRWAVIPVNGNSSRQNYALFRAWFASTLRHGAASFDLADPVDGVVKAFQFVIDNGAPFQSKLTNGVLWEISATIRTLE